MLHENHGSDLRHFRKKSKSWTAGILNCAIPLVMLVLLYHVDISFDIHYVEDFMLYI